MAYDFTAASSQHLSTAAAPANGHPMTLAVWSITNTTAPIANRLFAVSASNGDRHQLARNGNQIQCNSIGTSGAGTASANGKIVANTWFHLCGTFISSTSRKLFFNGAEEATNATNCGSQATFDRVLMGAAGSPLSLYYQGTLAECGVWNVELTQPEIASLAKGMTCDKVRPQSLVFYAPLVRDLVDAKGGLTITNNNTATVANHPRVYA